MDIDQDSLSRLAHASGMTDVEFDERAQVAANLAEEAQRDEWCEGAGVPPDPFTEAFEEVAKARRKAELEAPTAGEELEEFDLMERHARQQDEQDYHNHISDPYDDYDYGYHDQYDH